VTIPIGTPDKPGDLGAAVFAALASEFRQVGGEPIPFTLRDKRNTQDDPFDVHIGAVLNSRLPERVRVFVSGKPLVSPDLVIARPEEARVLMTGSSRDLDSCHAIGIEVKKLDWSATGPTRSTGMDYNSTPPCSSIKVDADNGISLRIAAFYLFVILKDAPAGRVMHSMALVSGAALNEDVGIYDAATGIRTKRIGLGSYGDGIDRQRPMFVFANPLGWPWLRGQVTLLHPSSGLENQQAVAFRRRLYRRTQNGELREFFCYRMSSESATEPEPDVTEPFPTPKNRTESTVARGRFRISLAAEQKQRPLPRMHARLPEQPLL
jgi:hypothetical protein